MIPLIAKTKVVQFARETIAAIAYKLPTIILCSIVMFIMIIIYENAARWRKQHRFEQTLSTRPIAGHPVDRDSLDSSIAVSGESASSTVASSTVESFESYDSCVAQGYNLDFCVKVPPQRLTMDHNPDLETVGTIAQY